MVVEMLTFEVTEAERGRWLEVEERHWSRYLEARPGFAGKQMWVEEGDPQRVHAVIWWESMADWEAVPAAETAAVDAAMGEWLRVPALRAFEVIRDC